jgi:hypothetical protein
VIVALISELLQQHLVSLNVFYTLLLHLAFVVAHAKFEKSLPAFLVRVESVVTLVAPFIVLLSFVLFPSSRYLHFAKFGCFKFLLGLLFLSPRPRLELLLSALSVTMWAVCPLLVSDSSSVSLAVSLVVAALGALLRYGQALDWRVVSSTVSVYLYLVVSRAFLPFVERELKLPLLFQNFCRSFAAFLLFSLVIALVRAVPSLDGRFSTRLPENWDVLTLLQLVVFAVGQSQVPVILIGVAVQTFGTVFSLVSVLIATTPLFAVLLKVTIMFSFTSTKNTHKHTYREYCFGLWTCRSCSWWRSD